MKSLSEQVAALEAEIKSIGDQLAAARRAHIAAVDRQDKWRGLLASANVELTRLRASYTALRMGVQATIVSIGDPQDPVGSQLDRLLDDETFARGGFVEANPDGRIGEAANSDFFPFTVTADEAERRARDDLEASGKLIVDFGPSATIVDVEFAGERRTIVGTGPGERLAQNPLRWDFSDVLGSGSAQNPAQQQRFVTTPNVVTPCPICGNPDGACLTCED